MDNLALVMGDFTSRSDRYTKCKHAFTRPLPCAPRSLDQVRCSSWEEALTAARKIGFPVELSLRKCLPTQTIDAAAQSSASLRRTAHHPHEYVRRVRATIASAERACVRVHVRERVCMPSKSWTPSE